MFRLSDGEEMMTLAFFVLIQYRSVTDGQTDRQTDRQTDIPPLAIPAVCIARYAKAVVKIGLKNYRHSHQVLEFAAMQKKAMNNGQQDIINN